METQVKTMTLLEVSKEELNPYKEQINQLLKDSEKLVVPVGNKELFTSVSEKGNEIWKLAVEIEKKTKEVKSKFTQASKEFQAFGNGLSEPLRKRVAEIKEALQPYKDAIEEAKNAKRLAIEQEEKRIAELAAKTQSLHTDNIVAISECETVADIEKIQKELESLDISKDTFQEKYAEANFIRTELLKKIEIEKGKIAAYELQQKELAELKEKQEQQEIEDKRINKIKDVLAQIKTDAMDILFDSENSTDKLEHAKKTLSETIKGYDFQEFSGNAMELQDDLIKKIDNRISELSVIEQQQQLITEENERRAKEQEELNIKKTEEKKRTEVERKFLIEDFDKKNIGDLRIAIESFNRRHSENDLLDQSTKDELGMFIENFTEKITNREIQENEIIYIIDNLDNVPAKYLHRTVNAEMVNEAIKSGTKAIKGLKIGKRIDLIKE